MLVCVSSGVGCDPRLCGGCNCFDSRPEVCLRFMLEDVPTLEVNGTSLPVAVPVTELYRLE